MSEATSGNLDFAPLHPGYSYVIQPLTTPNVICTMDNMAELSGSRLVICVANDGFPASLERLKSYTAVPDAVAEKHDMLRIIDESGEQYLYPKALFRDPHA